MLDDIERVTDRVMIMTEGRIVVDSSLPHFLSRLSIWSCECSEPLDRVQIPGLVSRRQAGRQTSLVIVDADDDTQQALYRLGGNTVRQEESTFDESVMAYMSRSRSAASLMPT